MMGIRVSGPEVVAFLEWLRKERPYVHAAIGIPRDELEWLAENFLSEHNMIPENEAYRETRGVVERYPSPEAVFLAEMIVHPEQFLESNKRYMYGAPRMDDLLKRYLTVPFRSIFLYTSQDELFGSYFRQHWSAWSDESGDLFDFYDFSIQTEYGDFYSFSREYILKLRAIPCADLAKIQAVGLPCMLLWSDYDDMIVPFRDVADSETGLRDRFRLVQKFLEQDQFDALRSYFADTIKQAVSSREDVFISYRQTDRDWVQQLHNALEEAGVSVWFDEHLRAGDRFDLRIQHHLSRAKAAIVVWSRSSIESGYVLAEALMAWDRKRLAPVLKDVPLEIPPPFNAVHSEDLSCWPSERVGFERLLERVKDARENDGMMNSSTQS